MQDIILQLCVSKGRAITMATPSNEYLLKSWAPLSLSTTLSVFYLLSGHSTYHTHNSQREDREDGSTGGFAIICSTAFFLSCSLPMSVRKE